MIVDTPTFKVFAFSFGRSQNLVFDWKFFKMLKTKIGYKVNTLAKKPTNYKIKTAEGTVMWGNTLNLLMVLSLAC